MSAVDVDEGEIRRLADDVIQRFVSPFCKKWEREKRFPAHEVFKEFGNAGLLGINKPAANGGAALGYRHHAQFARALGSIPSGGVSLALSVQTDLATPALAEYGTSQLKKQFLDPSISGDYVAALAVTEPGTGSDVSGIRTRCEISGENCTINGSKLWITNGNEADWFCLLAKTGPDSSNSVDVPLNMALVCVPSDARGVTVERTLETLGVHGSGTAALSFDNVVIPKSYVIGHPRKGFLYQMRQFQLERLSLTLATLESMRLTLASTVDYCRERKVRDRSILDYQYNRFALAELATELRMLESFVGELVDQIDQGNSDQADVAMAKLTAGRLARKLNDRCLQLWGAMGYSEENFIARKLRDERLLSIGGGSDEVMLEVIAHSL